jgi:hypothetical protein
LTVPVSRKVFWPIVETPMRASGMASASIASTLSRFEPTLMLPDQMMSPFALLA